MVACVFQHATSFRPAQRGFPVRSFSLIKKYMADVEGWYLSLLHYCNRFRFFFSDTQYHLFHYIVAKFFCIIDTLPYS